VQLVYYDDQSNPANVPPIYTKLLDVDKVDLIVSGYATPIIAAALPIAMQHDMVLMALFGLANNAKLKYDKYFGVAPIGEDPVNVLAKPFFDVADTLNPKPSTIAVITPDIQFGHAALEGVRNAAKARNMKVVYDRTFPPSMTDFSTVVREVQATNPDLVFVATQPGQSINVARAIAEVGLNAQMIGGGMTGLQTTDSETILGPQINGLVNFAYWLPAAKLQSPGAMDFLSKYQARAKAEGVDPIGYYVAPWAYADLQMLALGGRRNEEPGGRQARRLSARELAEHDHWRGEIWTWRRMGQSASVPDPVSEHQDQGPERIHGDGSSGRRWAARTEVRRSYLAVRQGAPLNSSAASATAARPGPH
jgi:branched-chain amino acid transport system substrate-binding protein